MGKLDLLHSLLGQLRPNLAEQFQPVKTYITDCLQGQRNIVAHGFWSTPGFPGLDPGGFVVKFQAKNKLIAQGGLRSIKELEDLALHIAEVTAWIMVFSSLLPKLKLRPGGLGHSTSAPRNPHSFATLRLRALQPPSRRWRASPPAEKQGAKSTRRKRQNP